MHHRRDLQHDRPLLLRLLLLHLRLRAGLWLLATPRSVVQQAVAIPGGIGVRLHAEGIAGTGDGEAGRVCGVGGLAVVGVGEEEEGDGGDEGEGEDGDDLGDGAVGPGGEALLLCDFNTGYLAMAELATLGGG